MKKRGKLHVYYTLPYKVDVLDQIVPGEDSFFNETVIHDFRNKYQIHNGFTPNQISAIGLALAAQERKRLSAQITKDIEMKIEDKELGEGFLRKMDPVTVQILENLLLNRYRYTPKAKISGIVEMVNGTWRESCLRHGQGTHRNEIVRKSNLLIPIKGKQYCIPLICVAYFLKEKVMRDGEHIRSLIAAGYDLFPYQRYNTKRNSIVGAEIDLEEEAF